MSRDIKYIIIHEAACPLLKPDGGYFTITDIERWHIERGFKRSEEWRKKFHPEIKACGYHYVVGVEGEIWEGRHLEEVPAAVKGFNSVSVNICLIGQGKYTVKEWAALKFLVTNLAEKYPGADIVGHCNPAFNSGKTCPDFDVPGWVADGMNPKEGHLA